MNQKIKKSLGLLLSLTLFLSLLPSTTLAAKSEVTESNDISSNSSTEVKEVADTGSEEMPTLFASASSYAPYANIEYSYSSSVSCGTIRYISQVSSGSHFYSQYWGSWASQASSECGTATISMALSYIGINKTPQNILDEGNGTTYFGRNWGGSTYSSPSIDNGINNYLNGNGKYSPVVVHIPKYSSGGHYVVIIGQMSSSQYQILDPWENSVTSMTINGSTATYTKSGSTITDTIDQVHQWYNANASIPNNNEITISGANSPGTITQGDKFSISGTISSGTSLTNVTVGCYDVDGNMKTGKSVSPNATSYDIKNLDSYVYFNNLAPSVYYYRVTATNSAGSKTLINKVFIVLSTSSTVSDGIYILESYKNTDYVVDIEGHNNNICANAIINTKENTPYQAFHVTYVGDGYYTLQNYASGYYLDVAGDDAISGENVQQHTMKEQWQLLPVGNSYCLVPKIGTSLCLDIQGGTMASGTNIQVYTANLTDAQKYNLVQTDCNFPENHKITFDMQGGAVTGSHATYTVDGVNVSRGEGELIIYDNAGTTPDTNSYGREIAVNANGYVSAVRAYGDENQLTVPSGGFIVSGHHLWDTETNSAHGGVEFTNQVSVGDYVSYNYDTKIVSAYHDCASYLSENKYVSDDATYGVLPLPVKDNYRFAGWYTEAEGGTQISYSSIYYVSKLYAHWIKEGEEAPIITAHYNNHSYELYDLSLSWTDAKQFCESKGGYLVCITDANENDTIVELITQGSRGTYWIGCTDEETEGVWKWVSGEEFSYSNWDPDLPEPSGEDYGTIIAIDNPPNKQISEWNDTENYFTGNTYYNVVNTGFVCERNLSELGNCSITLSANSYVYNGNEKKPSVTVRDDSTVLTEGEDYTVTYSDNINAGTASVTITGIGNYTGEVSKTFTIKKAEQTITLSGTSFELEIGEQVDLDASAVGELSYECDNGDVAEVSYDGKVTGVGEGNANVTVIAAGSENYNEANIIVEITVVAKKAKENPFTDVKESEYYYDAVLWAYENGITSGATATTFNPEETCTRAQIVTFIWRAMGEPEPESDSNPFTDIKYSEYYYKAILWAYQNGIANGITSTTFQPDSIVTRAQAVTFLWRAEGKPDASVENPFTDVKEAEYYYDAVLWAYENNITTGVTETLFKPASTCTRAQIVTFLYRDMEK